MSRQALSGSFNLSMRNRNRKFDLIVSSLCLPACLRLTSSLWKKTNTIEELKIVLENRTTICGLLSLRTHDNELQTYGGCFDVTRCCHGMKLATVTIKTDQSEFWSRCIELLYNRNMIEECFQVLFVRILILTYRNLSDSFSKQHWWLQVRVVVWVCIIFEHFHAEKGQFANILDHEIWLPTN